MKTSLLAGAAALSLGVVSNASAIIIDITSMSVSGTPYSASGVISTNAIGESFSSEDFFSFPWVGTTLAVFDTAGSYSWAGSSIQGDYSYSFTLSADQYAFGTYFDWSVNYDVPVILIFDCSNGYNCNGLEGYPMQLGFHPGNELIFNGVITAVPVPAAIWLFGSGLIGLMSAGIYKRSRKVLCL